MGLYLSSCCSPVAPMIAFKNTLGGLAPHLLYPLANHTSQVILQWSREMEFFMLLVNEIAF